jgi:hypothetical protein
MFPQTWPHCTAIEIGGYLFLNDSLPEDTSPMDCVVVKRPTQPGARFLQIDSVLLAAYTDDGLLGHIRRTLRGDYDALATNCEVDPRLETASEHAGWCCPFCTPFDGDRAAMLASLPDCH